ncbi:MAG: SCO family protein [Candidatus Acidiferrales bacterium]
MRFEFQSRAVRFSLLGVILAATLMVPSVSRAQFMTSENIGVHPDLLKQVRFDEELNHTIPLNLTFRDEHGQTVRLGQYFGTKPVILTLNYYTCPMLCTQVLNGLDRALENIKPTLGKDFNVVTVSIDPNDTPVLAAAKQAMYTGMYGRPGAENGWNFLVGKESQIKQLADAVGFHYAYDPGSKQFAHAAGIMVLTPQGKLSNYFYGVQYKERDLRLALDQASEGKIGSPVDHVLLYCYHYDPHTGKYGLLISRVIKIAGGLTVLIGGIILIFLFRSEHYALPETKA